jgi:hypothetical protein
MPILRRKTQLIVVFANLAKVPHKNTSKIDNSEFKIRAWKGESWIDLNTMPTMSGSK